MTYLVAADLPTEPAGHRFRKMVEAGGILQIPGTHNGMAALQARAAGFAASYLSGAAMTASMGLPDLGMITVDEVCFFIRQVVRASGLPVLVDGDTGYGEALNVMAMVRSFEDAGAAAVHIEDQILPKKCGHLNDKKLADAHDMANKVATARKARRHLYLMARTDAAASEGMDGAVHALAKLYVEAGADAIFPEALHDAEMFREFARRMPGVPGIGPVPAVRRLLERTGMRVQQFDVIESNEAFAAQACAVARELGFDPAKLNPNGGAIALGHPIGATGTILVVKAAYELQRTSRRYGLVTMCIGGGQGIALAIERVA